MSPNFQKIAADLHYYKQRIDEGFSIAKIMFSHFKFYGAFQRLFSKLGSLNFDTAFLTEEEFKKIELFIFAAELANKYDRHWC